MGNVQSRESDDETGRTRHRQTSQYSRKGGSNKELNRVHHKTSDVSLGSRKTIKSTQRSKSLKSRPRYATPRKAMSPERDMDDLILTKTQIIMVERIWKDMHVADEPAKSIWVVLLNREPVLERTMMLAVEERLKERATLRTIDQINAELDRKQDDQRKESQMRPKTRKVAVVDGAAPFTALEDDESSLDESYAAKSPTSSKLPDVLLSLTTRNSAILNAHANRFNQVLDMIVTGLQEGSLSSVTRLLLYIGSKHRTLVHASGFSPKYWNIFAEHFMHKSLGWGSRHQRTAATYETWSKIILYMTSKMRQGYLQAVREERLVQKVLSSRGGSRSKSQKGREAFRVRTRSTEVGVDEYKAVARRLESVSPMRQRRELTRAQTIAAHDDDDSPSTSPTKTSVNSDSKRAEREVRRRARSLKTKRRTAN